MSDSAAPLQRAVGPSFVPLASAAPRNSGAPFEAASEAAGAGLKLQDALQQAADQHAQNQQTIGLTKKIDDLKIQYAQDPDPATATGRFETEAQKAVNDAVGQLPQNPQMREQFADQWGLHIEAARTDVKLGAVRRVNDETKASALSVGDDTAQRAPYANPAERALLFSQANDALTGAVKVGAMTAKEAQTYANKWHSDLAQFDARKAILDNPQAGLALLQDPKNFPDLDPVKRLELQEHADAAIRTGEREDRVARTYEKADLRSDLTDVITQLNAGLPVDPATVGNLRSRVQATGDPGLLGRFGAIEAHVVTQDKLRGAAPAEVDRVIDNLTAEGTRNPTAQVASALSSARAFRTRMQAGLQHDQLTWAASQGVVKLAPLNLNGTDSAAAWKARALSADTAARTYGRSPIYLTGGEADTLKAALKTADPDTKLQTAEMLIGGLGDRATAAFAQIAPGDGVWAQAGMLAQAGKKDAAHDALIGQALLHEKGSGASPLLPTAAAHNSPDGAPLVNEAFRFAPQLASHVLATADALYAARARTKGLSGADAAQTSDGEDLYARAVQEAAGAGYDTDGTRYGGIVQFHGRPVAAPATIKADDFESIVKGLSPQQVALASVRGGAPVTADGKAFTGNLGEAYLIAVGDGRYAVSTTDPSDEAHLLQDGKARAPFVLDLHKVLPWLNGSSH